MTPRTVQLAGALGEALALEALIGGPLCLLLWALGRGRAVPLALACLLPVLLGHVPLPDRAAMDCAGAPRILLVPFGQFAAEARAALRDGDPMRFATGLTLLATVMNVALLMPAGAALRRVTARGGAAFALGLALPAAIEGSQVTGAFGLYPCAWRTFETTDFVTNAAGVWAGFALASRWRGGRAGRA